MTDETDNEEAAQDQPPTPIKLPDLGWDYVDTQEGLKAAVADLAGSPVLGIDTESDSFFSYRESCCLVQITGEGTRDYIIDPLALDNLDALAPLCADPSVVKIFHGADYDVVSMKRDFGVEFHNIFDTMISAQATGHERFGLNDLVQRYFGQKLNKKWQRHDWSSRPLLEVHLDYARNDSHFLPRLREILLAQAAERGRLEMLQEEFELLEGREWTGRTFSADDCMRVKGAKALDDAARLILRSVYTLREEKAEARNRPPFKIWGNDVLLRVAADAPESIDALKKCLGAHHHVVRRHAEDVLDAVQDGLDDDGPPPEPPKPRGPKNPDLLPVFREDEPLVLKLKNWRNKRAQQDRLGPGMIINNTVIGQVAATKPREVADLESIVDMRRWQRVQFGEAIVAVVTAWLDSRPPPGQDEPPPGKKKRRRRRRRRQGPDATEGSSTEGGSTEGGSTEGGSTEGGSTEGGSTEGGQG